MNKNEDDDDSKMMDAAVMLSSMSWLSSSPKQQASSKSASSAEKPEESNGSSSGDALLGLILAADIASNQSSRKRKTSSKDPTGTTTGTTRKKEATGDGRAKKARSTKASTPRSSSKRKTPSATTKPRGPKAAASVAAALPQEDGTQVASLKVGIKRIEELESQLDTLSKHATKLEEENEALKNQMKDMVKKKVRKPAAKRTKGPAVPRSNKVSSTLGNKPLIGLPMEIAKGKAKTDKKPVKTTISGRSGTAPIRRPNNQQQGVLSINMPVLRDAKQQKATLKAPPVVTPPQTTSIQGNIISMSNPQEEFKQLLAALLGGEGFGTSQQEKHRQEQDAQQQELHRRQQEQQQQQQQQQQAQGFFASADNNFNRLILEGFANQANSNKCNNNVQQNQYDTGSSMKRGTVQSNNPLSSSASLVKNQSSPPLQSQQQEPSFAEFVQQQLTSLQTQQVLSAANVNKTDSDVWALLAPKELTPKQDKHAVVVEPLQQEQSNQGGILAWLLQQQLQQQQSPSSPGPSKPETTGFGHVTNGYMPNRQEPPKRQQSPRTVSQVFTVPEHQHQQQQQSFAATVSPRSTAEGSPLPTSVASNSAATNNASNNMKTTSQSLLLNGQDFQSLQNYFTPEALLAILGAAQQH